MTPLILAAGETLLRMGAPILADIFRKGSDAAKAVVVKKIESVAGVTLEDIAQDRITPEQQAKILELQQAELPEFYGYLRAAEESQVTLADIQAKDTQSARRTMASLAQKRPSVVAFQAFLGFAASVFCALYIWELTFSPEPLTGFQAAFGEKMAFMLIGGVIGAVFGTYFGTSTGSWTKQDQINEMLKKVEPK